LAALGGDASSEALLSRVPDDYYDDEEVAELRARFADPTDARNVYRDILDNVIGAGHRRNGAELALFLFAREFQRDGA